MASRNRRRPTARKLFADGQPERLRDLRVVHTEPGPQERRDGPAGRSGNSGSSGDNARKASGPRLTLSMRQKIFAVGCSEAFWAEAGILQRAVDEFDCTPPQAIAGDGLETTPQRTCSPTARWSSSAGACTRPTARSTPIPHAGLVPSLWDETREALEHAWPDRPERRLSAKPVTRRKYHDFCEAIPHRRHARADRARSQRPRRRRSTRHRPARPRRRQPHQPRHDRS